MSFRQFAAVVFSMMILCGTGIAAPSVTLGWNPSSVGALGGYRLYQGFASQNYSSVTDVGLATNATVIGLMPGKTYYFAVTLYETNGLESALSGEVSYTVPISGAWVQMSVNKAKQVVLTGTAPAGYIYDVQASASPANSANWSKIGSVTVSTTNSFQFTDLASATNKARFYRLRQTSP